ncbi:DUF1707 domain-containing protein [Streptomyces sp. PmtG]
MAQDMSSRISDKDRDTAIERLQEAFAEGIVTRQEMDERLQLALTAQTQGDLVPVTDSLPEKKEEEDTGTTVTVKAMGGRVKRKSRWRVPRFFTVDSEFAKVDLDLSEAIIDYPVIDIELRLRHGWAHIILPRNATVEYEELSAGWKQPVYKPAPSGTPGGPHIRISGSMNYGRLKIRHRRRWR